MPCSTGPAYAKPRATLLTIPDEIIEQIADDIRSDVLDEGLESAKAYILENVTDFGNSRFDLSSFSKVCAALRRPVERRMYRDIHVNFAGWDATHDFFFPNCRGASLRLLIRTLEDRIDLRGRVRSVHMDWYDDDINSLEPEDFIPVSAALRQFFSLCPSTRTLLIKSFPSQIFSEITCGALSNITTASVATVSPLSTDIFPVIVKTFPALKDLYLTHFPMDATPPTHMIHHRLRKLNIEGFGNKSLAHFVFWSLEVCADITEELYIKCLGHTVGCRVEDSFLPTRHRLSPLAGTNLRSLRLDGDRCNFLAHPNSNLAHVIRRLPSLQHLHMSSRPALHPTAFSALPPSLRSLYLSGYGSWGPCHEFVVALSKCLAEAADRIEMVAVFRVTKEDIEGKVLGYLSPLHRVCDDHNIPFQLDIHRESFGLLGDIRILFA